MICPACNENNLPGLDLCRNCSQDLTQLDRPVAHDRVERSLMDDTVSLLRPRPAVTAPPEASVAEAIRLMVERNIGTVLVTDRGGGLLGIFSERDLLLKVAGTYEDQAGRPVREFMTCRPETVRESDSLAFALHKMDCGDYRHLPVLRDGKLLGVISVRDLLRHITRICAANGTGT
jgi:CBS domain-containing protein